MGLGSFLLLKEKQKKNEVLELKERTGQLKQLADWPITKERANQLLNDIKTDPNNDKAKLGLSEIFIQEARITGDHVYYDMAAMHYVNQVLSKDSLNFEALTYKSLIYLSQHHFSDGLAYAIKANHVNPYNAFIFGVITDSYVELGEYDKAIEAADKMMSIRPDLRSYSRVSYLREIYGDYPGAIEAMKLAVEAGAPGDESTAWAAVHLGQLYERIGDFANAEMCYKITLEDRPNYAYAYAGLAHIFQYKKSYKQAIANYIKADSLVIDYVFKDELCDLYILDGQNKKAKEMREIVISQLSDASKKGMEDEAIGHYADKELAYVYMKAANYNKALEHAQAEYNRRPNNIEVNECLAWAYYMNKEYVKANQHIKIAMRTNTKNPISISRAAIISAAAGDNISAKKYLVEIQIKDELLSADLLAKIAQLKTSI